jgi:hypothetical protein
MNKLFESLQRWFDIPVGLRFVVPLSQQAYAISMPESFSGTALILPSVG